MSDEHALQSRHTNSVTVLYAIPHYLLHLPSEALHVVVRTVACHLSVAVKVCEQRSSLLWNCIVDERGQVDAARPDECGIESVNVVRREEYDPLFARGNTVQSVQKSREGHGRLISASRSVHVSQKDEQAGRVLSPTYPSSLVCTRLLNAASTSSMRMKLLSGAFDIK